MPPAEEIAALQARIADMERNHAIALARETATADRYKADAEAAREERDALLESPLLRILANGGNLPDIEDRLTDLCVKCANANTNVKGAMTLKIGVASGRSGDGSVEFNIQDSVKQPVEDEGACILWIAEGKLSESSAKQRELIEVEAGKRRPNPTAEEKLAAAKNHQSEE